MEISGNFYDDVFMGIVLIALFLGWIVFIPFVILLVSAVAKKKFILSFVSLLFFFVPLIAVWFASLIDVHPKYNCRESFYTSDGCVGSKYVDFTSFFVIAGWIIAPIFLAISLFRGKEQSHD